ncbi:fumarase, class I alpha subunit [Methanococcoides vulcani]|uniref:Fumarase, class I alpha subunit n=1 Tax=Methanococcoides vulcani TaxID=1353158 RepID=A0A1I0BSP9_9EURY|nr:fumarate hydratase [Methanococcoides vulcani]SET09770.1 fumarase, class I alpha subunit [Methanococcoides vulcani]
MTGKITYDAVVKATVNTIKEAETLLPDDVIKALETAKENESSDVARSQIEAILKNIEIAGNNSIPLCQDTGILIFYVEIGRDLHIDFDLKGAILEATRIATQQVPLRPNAVDPLSRSNSNDNTGEGLPDIKYDFVEGKQLKITVAPKGAGSENMSVLKMMNPTELKSIDDFIVETVLNAGGRPCPPVIVGVGIGGSFDKAARLAKSSLLRTVNDMNDEEKTILARINSLGIGPMGLGGDTTALAVHLNTSHCHTASLPVAINIQCWANRHASVILGGKE